jgi:hypothetical protein
MNVSVTCFDVLALLLLPLLLLLLLLLAPHPAAAKTAVSAVREARAHVRSFA